MTFSLTVDEIDAVTYAIEHQIENLEAARSDFDTAQTSYLFDREVARLKIILTKLNGAPNA